MLAIFTGSKYDNNVDLMYWASRTHKKWLRTPETRRNELIKNYFVIVTFRMIYV